MKKIAVIMESWVRCFTFAWPSGMIKRIREIDEEINIYIFNCSANWSSDLLYNKGEYNIFNLPDFSDFDGIILDLNNTKDENVRNRVIERTRLSGVPAIVINNQYDGLYSVGIDNYNAMKRMVDHLYREHKCRRFWFIMGPDNNYENNERSKALRDYMEDNSIPSDDYSFYYGDFDYNSGVLGFNELLDKFGKLPDAIMCANDNIAVGFISEAEKHGYKAPKDFLITGFDDLDKSRYYIPRISTISYIREDIGYKCIDMFLNIWSGVELPAKCYTDSRPIFWESCGCPSAISVKTRNKMKSNILWEIEREYFEGNVLTLDSKLAGCETIDEMAECILESVPIFNCDAMYFVMDKHLVDINNMEIEDVDIDKISNYDDNFLVEGYPEKMTILFSYEKGKRTKIPEDRKVIDGLFPAFDLELGGANFLFLPLHFRDKCIGYFAIKNAIYLMEQQFLFEIVNAIITGIEQLYAKQKLARMNRALSLLYHHDAMTMVYNRFGFVHYAYRLFDEAKESGKAISVIYYDLDRLKYLNDNYGHEMGDKAIKTVAQLIKTYSSDKAMVFRLGGDEFLALDYYISEELVKETIDKVKEELRRISKDDSYPIDLSVSVGYAISNPLTNEELDFYVNMADDIMYQSKVERKMNRRD